MSVSRRYVTSKAINRSKGQCKEVISVLQNVRFEGEFIAMLANNEKCNKTNSSKRIFKIKTVLCVSWQRVFDGFVTSIV